jgi:hypothetical protein
VHLLVSFFLGSIQSRALSLFISLNSQCPVGKFT